MSFLEISLSASWSALILFIWLDASCKLAAAVRSGNLNNTSSGCSKRLMLIRRRALYPLSLPSLVDGLPSALLRAQQHLECSHFPSKHFLNGALVCNDFVMFALVLRIPLAPNCKPRFPNAFIVSVIDCQLRYKDCNILWLCWLLLFGMGEFSSPASSLF